MEIRSYGVSPSKTAASDQDHLIEEFKINGFAVVGNVLDQRELEKYNRLAEEVYAIQQREFGAESIVAIGDNDMTRAALAYADEFLELVFNEQVLPFLGQILGDYYILSLQNCIINRPAVQHRQSSWHRDLPYQEFTSSKPLGVNVFYCLCDFNALTGGTVVLPGSHRLEEFPSANYVQSHEFQIEAPAGAAILFDPMLYHRAGLNRSKIVRRGVNQLYTRAFIKQQINLARLLASKELELTDFQRQVLGFSSDVVDSVMAWRQRRLENIRE